MRITAQIILLILTTLMVISAGEQAKKKAPLPPFRIKADEMEIDLIQKTQIYSGNVIFKTKYNSTSLICDKITSDSNSAKNTTMVKATGAVKISMITEPESKNSAVQIITGDAPVITYFMQDNDAIIKMESADVNGKKVLPVLTSVDKETGDKTTVTGKVIIYNQKTGKLNVKEGDVEGGEDKANG